MDRNTHIMKVNIIALTMQLFCICLYNITAQHIQNRVLK